MSSPDIEALVSPKIAAAVEAAIQKVGRDEFLALAGIDDKLLEMVLKEQDQYVTVAFVTLTCQINRSHNDQDPAHSSLTECLKGTTIRIPPTQSKTATSGNQKSPGRPERGGTKTEPTSTGPLFEKKTLRLMGFGVNLFSFFILGYFLGGIALSPLIGQPSCVGVVISPFSLVPCTGSIIGLVVSAIGGLGYTYYFFVKRL